MAQIFGCIGFNDATPVARLLDRMGRLQQRSSQAPADTWMDDSAGAGIGGLFSREQGRMGALGTPDGATGTWVLDGEVYRLSASALSVPDPGGQGRIADAIPSLYAHFGNDLAAHLDGSFCLALYDSQRKALMLATDRFATRTMYWAHTHGVLLFASELKALLAAPFLPRTIDVHTLSQSFAFNRVLGEGTLLKHVRRLPPATILEYDAASGAIKQHAYWRAHEEVQHRLPLSSGRLEAMVDAFRQAVVVRTASARRVGVSLSGGLDSRAIVAVIAHERREALTCTTGIEGCADQRLAEKIARVAATTHSFYALKRDAIEGYLEALRTAILLTDGMVLVGGFPAGLTQRFCDDGHIDMLLRGHGGENARLADAWPFQVDPTVLNLQPGPDLLNHLRRHLWTAPEQLNWDRLFPDPETRPSAELADASLSELLCHFPDHLSSAEIMNLLYLSQNDAIGPPATRNALRAHAEMGLPYLDYSFMSLALATDARQRCGPAIHHAIVRRHSPPMMNIPNSNTGAPLDASPLRLALTDRMNSLMRRLQLPGFRHYHYMELWIRDVLAEQVRHMVLDERTISRGLYDRTYLTQLVERARGDASLSRVLNLIVNLEVWFRLFCDGEVFLESSLPST